MKKEVEEYVEKTYVCPYCGIECADKKEAEECRDQCFRELDS